MNKEIIQKAKSWLVDGIDADTKAKIHNLIDTNPEELFECFYKDLEFGTGGMRGKMGVGSNRVNIYTIGMATQGLANYMNQQFPKGSAVAIAYDPRNNSPLFAKTAANVLTSNGIKVYLFDALRPTPELSYAVRLLGCQSGIVITASHNPKEYNGYKVYWDDGAQIVSPHDKRIIAEVRKIASITDVKLTGNDDLLEMIGAKVDSQYLAEVKKLTLSPKSIEEATDLKIVYTALHGTGITLIPEALKQSGFKNVILVPEQDIPDGNFSTVESPNPEEKEALSMALDLAKKENADLVLGTDPDADRVGLAVRNQAGDFELVNGNQACLLMVWYHLKMWKELGKLNGKQFVAKTIVTTELIDRLTDKYGVNLYNTLTGFKFIAGVIRELEGKEEFITGGEESFGYLAGDFVRDKDAVISSVMFCEMAAWAKCNNKTLLDVLDDIYIEYGYFMERLISLKKEGSKGQEEIGEIMKGYRNSAPKTIGGNKVIRVVDVLEGIDLDLKTGIETKLDLPESNVMQFYTEDGSKITARPSGTEPKIKFYISVNDSVSDNLASVKKAMKARLDTIQENLGV